jgi:hypothetical protein
MKEIQPDSEFSIYACEKGRKKDKEKEEKGQGKGSMHSRRDGG